MSVKKIPLRKCIACNQSYPKKELIRIVINDEAKEVDPTGRKNGRGAYVCRKTECILLAKKKKFISDEIAEELKEVIIG